MADDRDKLDLLPPQPRTAPAASENPAVSPPPDPSPPLANPLPTDALPPPTLAPALTSDWQQFNGIQSDKVPHHVAAATKAQRQMQKNMVLFGVCIVLLVIV